MTTLRIIIQDFEAAIANGGYGGTRHLSPQSELLLLSAYNYVFDASWKNDDGYSPLTPEQQVSIDRWVSRAQDELMTNTQIGTVIWSMVAPADADDNLLVADGSLVLVDDYPELAERLTSLWIVSLGSIEYIQLPNLINAYASGRLSGNMLSRVGANDVSLTIAQMPNHSHTVQVPRLFPTSTTPGPSASSIQVSSTVVTSSAAGSGLAHENRPLTQYLYPYVIAL